MKKIALLLVLLIAGCHPALESPTEPLGVRPSDLMQSYRDQTSAAQLAYDNVEITVRIRNYVVKGNEIHWHLGTNNYPASIVFVFFDPIKADGSITIRGVCRGRYDDGKPREQAGMTFSVQVTGCQLVIPAKQ